MRRITLFAIMLLAVVGVTQVSAQQLVYKRIGIFNENGEVVLSDATTTLVVDLTVECESFTVGPYARYAQKLLGTRASLADRTTYNILSADISVAADGAYFASDLVETSTEESVNYTSGYGSLTIDRTLMTEKTVESAAYDAAEKIFELRRARLDLVTGEFGDGVFGAGLESALREIDRLEQSYLELFFGKCIKSVTTKRLVLPVSKDAPHSVIARFSTENGIVKATDIDGEIVMVSIIPSSMSYPASDAKGKIAYRYANNANVILSVGQTQLVERQLPIFEFGETVMYVAPAR